MPDEKLGKYEIRGQLGKGAMGTVYDGWDPILERRVAIKTVRLPSGADVEAQDDLARFRREAQAAGRLTHANIVGTYDYGETSDVAYIVMEFVDGRTLKDLLDRKEVMPLPNLVRVMDDLLAGLQYSHDRGVVHRDIKPANIMLTKEGQAKIADFGIARIENSSMTQAGTVLGTPAYMSPEQFMGNVVDLRTDIYSSGVLLYQLLTGERPFEGSMTAIMHKVLNVPPPKPSDLSVTCPPGFDAVVARAMAKRPDDRFPSATAFAEAIRAAQPALAGAADPLAGPDPLFDEGTVVMTAPRAAAAAQPAPHDPTVVARRAEKRSGGMVLPIGIAAAVVLAALGGGGAYFMFAGATTPPETNSGSNVDVKTASNDTSKAPASTPPGKALPPIVNVPQVKPPVGSNDTNPPPVLYVNPPTPPITTVNPVTPPGPLASTPPPITNVNPVTPSARPVNTPPPPIVDTNPVNVPAGHTNPPPPIANVTPVKPPSNANQPPVADANPPTRTPPMGNPPPIANTNPVNPAINPSGNPPAVMPPVPPTTDPPVQTAMVTRSLDEIRANVDAALKATNCAVLADTVGGTSAAPSIGVDGAAGPEAAGSLRATIDSIAAGQTVRWNVRTVKPVFCPALDIVRPIAVIDRPGGISAMTDKKVFYTKDLLKFRVTMPDWPAHLHVAYLPSDNSVAYITPSIYYPDSTYTARSTHQFGDKKAGFDGWLVGDPYGTDIIIAIASSAELMPPRPAALDKNKDGEDDAADYLNDLRAAIDAAGNRQGNRLTATVLLVDTVETATKP